MARKAITPIISTILLIMLVVAVTGGAWYWLTNVQGGLQGSVGSTVEDISELGNTQFQIVNVLCRSSDNRINITVLNTGSTTIADTALWIGTLSNISGAVLATNPNMEVGAISPDAVTTIYWYTGGGTLTNSSTQLGPGVSYSIKLNVGSTSQTGTCTAS